MVGRLGPLSPSTLPMWSCRGFRNTLPTHKTPWEISLPGERHLRRLDSVWIDSPIYFITSCTAGRRPVLANRETHAVLREEFETAPKRYGWTIGRVVMPDHLHCRDRRMNS